jgi:hypothetical protein
MFRHEIGYIGCIRKNNVRSHGWTIFCTGSRTPTRTTSNACSLTGSIRHHTRLSARRTHKASQRCPEERCRPKAEVARSNRVGSANFLSISATSLVERPDLPAHSRANEGKTAHDSWGKQWGNCSPNVALGRGLEMAMRLPWSSRPIEETGPKSMEPCFWPRTRRPPPRRIRGPLDRSIRAKVVPAVGACSTHHSALQAPEGEQVLVTSKDEAAVFSAAYDALAEAAPDTPIVDLDGPIRGFAVERVHIIDRYTTVVRIFPASGQTSSGQTIVGYYPEVSGHGTLFDGPSFDSRVYESVLSRMGKIGEQVKVTRLGRTNYLTERDRWRLNSSPSLRDGGTIKIEGSNPSKPSVTERLKELDHLKAQGLISSEEYSERRKAILNDL